MVRKKPLALSVDPEPPAKDKPAIEELLSEINAVAGGVETKLMLDSDMNRVIQSLLNKPRARYSGPEHNERQIQGRSET